MYIGIGMEVVTKTLSDVEGNSLDVMSSQPPTSACKSTLNQQFAIDVIASVVSMFTHNNAIINCTCYFQI